MLNPLIELQINSSNRALLVPRVANALWKLAEQDGDPKPLITLLQHAATPEIRKAAVLRKEASVRIAYLCHPGTSADERAQLLDKERRADVFAGLIQAAKKDDAIRDRLAAQFKQKPTKALAKAVLREGFPDTTTEVAAAALLQGDSALSDSIKMRMARVIGSASSEAEHRSFLVAALTVPFLLELNVEHLNADEQALYISKLVDYHHSDSVSENSWEARRITRHVESSLMRLCDSDKLSANAAAQLVILEDDESFESEFRGRLSSVLTARGVDVTNHTAQSNTLAVRALTAVGSDLDTIVEYAADTVSLSQAVVEALLSNPAILTHPQLDDLISSAHARAELNAVRATRSPELFKAIYRVSGFSFADKAWEFIDNGEDVAIELLNDPSKGRRAHYNSHHEQTYLLATFANERVLRATPWRVMNAISRGWSTDALHGAVGEVLQQMQLDKLGDDFGRWQQFNSLSQNWDGTFGDLLDAAASL